MRPMSRTVSVSSWKHPGIFRSDCTLTLENQAREESFELDTVNEGPQNPCIPV